VVRPFIPSRVLEVLLHLELLMKPLSIWLLVAVQVVLLDLVELVVQVDI
jgi:hypothetical protein